MTELGFFLKWLPRSIEQQIPHPSGKSGGFGMTWRGIGGDEIGERFVVAGLICQ